MKQEEAFHLNRSSLINYPVQNRTINTNDEFLTHNTFTLH